MKAGFFTLRHDTQLSDSLSMAGGRPGCAIPLLAEGWRAAPGGQFGRNGSPV